MSDILISMYKFHSSKIFGIPASRRPPSWIRYTGVTFLRIKNFFFEKEGETLRQNHTQRWTHKCSRIQCWLTQKYNVASNSSFGKTLGFSPTIYKWVRVSVIHSMNP
jgi:hypothetical protein